MTRKLAAPLLLVAILLAPGAPLIAAAQSSDSVPLALDLDEPLCAVDLNLTPGSSFGTWKWNGSEWVNTNWSLVGIYANFLALPHDGRCTVVVAFSGLSGPAGSIPASSFFAFIWFQTSQSPRYTDVDGWTGTATIRGSVPVRAFDMHLELDNIPATLPPGHYTGNLGITVSNAT